MKKIYNFNAGPSALPKKLIFQIKKEIFNWENTGTSIMEISHRHEKFIKMTQKVEKNLRNILNIPENYKIIFCHGGARGQFSSIPLNLFSQKEKIDYIISGHWSKVAAHEASKYSNINYIDIRKNKKNIIELIPFNKWKLSKTSKFVHYCSNETIDGISIKNIQNKQNEKIFIADFSSNILSKKININKFGLIYAGAQKNMGASGMTLVIIRDDLINTSNKLTPSIFNYKLLLQNNSLYNTPSCFSWYICKIMLDWIQEQGGIKKMEKENKKKSKILYNTIDKSYIYENKVHKKYRSSINIPFELKNKNLNNIFIKKTLKNGLLFLKGHIKQGGMRASIYNSMPISGVKKLSKFMKKFEKKYKNKI